MALVELEKKEVQCESQVGARPLCWRSRLSQGEVQTQRFQTFLQGLQGLGRSRPLYVQEQGLRRAKEVHVQESPEK